MYTSAKILYPNLMAELARAGLTVLDLAEKADMSYTTLMDKLRGRSDFKVKEARLIKSILNLDISIDELFERAA